MEEISFAVIEQLNISFCAQCGRDVLHNEFLVCYPESPSFVTYRARLEGTSDTDSDSLISLIEKWVVRGGVVLNSTGGLVQVDSDCSVVISSFSEPECSLTNDRANNRGTYSGGFSGGKGGANAPPFHIFSPYLGCSAARVIFR